MNFDFYGVGALHFRFETIMVTTPRKQRSYTIAEKREALQLIDTVGEADALRHLGYPRRNLRDWAAKRAKIFDYRGAQTSKTLKGQATLHAEQSVKRKKKQDKKEQKKEQEKKEQEKETQDKEKQDKEDQDKETQDKETQENTKPYKEKQDGGKEGTEELGKQKEMTAAQDDPAGECKSKKVVKKPRGKTGRKCAKGKDGKKVKQSGKGKKSKKSK
ncbi:hypothetical protein PR002_g15287 [Phytophthora rubi]|uniref:HTH psq-type domain-containing protein n=1 Tax=Phytophthora rubi TaxID=129364 RepID=A0A6A3KYQ3_9STRA|nr:hypothetical protein PR002_g15287 [Phytophthora rubi]